jgi:hypothetical protein
MEAAKERGVPLRDIVIQSDAIASLYGRKLVLVRPDGHIAWRGDVCHDAGAIIDCVRGRGARAPRPRVSSGEPQTRASGTPALREVT